MTPVPGSQPNSDFYWALSGAGCSGSTCGTLTVTTTQAAGANPISGTANYIAPSSLPQPNTVVPALQIFPADPLAPYALSYQLTSPGSIAIRWSTALGSNPLIIMTLDQTLTGRLHGIELTIQQSLSVWTGVQATTLPHALSAPSRCTLFPQILFPCPHRHRV
jgi:hypothetical protein